MNFRTTRRERLELSLTPMIDVVFLLLIFFMVTTTFERQAQLKLELPQAKSAVQSPRQKPLEVVIDAAGHYYIGEHELVNTRLETLKRAMQRALQQGVRPVVVIVADKRTPHQAVIRVLDAARQLGLSHISFATETTQE
ncbi:biopolymer transport protein ExbD [Methylomarinovum caldicuralii]|uniref:Biopolymer transport protein ExbD n=1 Tax=Methylomarinovum caldicuralii TaxID=438856 RepID=A0AAU9CDQ6_9GAMM|nr:biopolymer transporter ExbD [Methylomarinovum caldicuralii]BCX81110.1 biopolymer transport protein ExbD [Methylomarinovum caldicuralii]